MAQRRWPLGVLALAVLALGVLVWLSIRDVDAPVVPPRPSAAAVAVEAPPEAPSLEVPLDAGSAPLTCPDGLAFAHVADPCVAGRDPDWPSEYQSITRYGITVAWSSSDTKFHALIVAATVRGILDEAADVTGLPAREKLAVVVHPSHEEYIGRTQGPVWSGGLYDGAALQLAMETGGDLNVRMATLRHEAMHAHLHAAVGCMPAWFNEGMAMWFANEAPIVELVFLLKEGGPMEPEIDNATLGRLDALHAKRAYAESLGRIVYIVAHGGGDIALRDVAAAVRATSGHGRTAVNGVWTALFPRGDSRAVLDALSRQVFDRPFGTELDTVLHGPVCCSGYGRLDRVACRPTQPRREDSWMDHDTHAFCKNRW